MPTINVTKSFPWSPNGKDVIDYGPGQHDVPERCAVVAVDQLKVATLVDDAGKAKAEEEARALEEAKAKSTAEAAALAAALAAEEKAKAEAEAKPKPTTKK